MVGARFRINTVGSPTTPFRRLTPLRYSMITLGIDLSSQFEAVHKWDACLCRRACAQKKDNVTCVCALDLGRLASQTAAGGTDKRTGDEYVFNTSRIVNDPWRTHLWVGTMVSCISKVP